MERQPKQVSGQLELFKGRSRTPEDVSARFNLRRRVPVQLTLHRNRVTMVSATFKRGDIRLRMHEAFLDAPETVIIALDRYLRHRTRADWEYVAAFSRTIDVDPGRKRAPAKLAQRGTHFDLSEICERINARHFEGRLRSRITWGQHGRPSRGRRRSIRYGSYERDADLVRIHPALDDARVPLDFVEYIVFHELLHAVIPAERKGNRVNHHPAAYRRAEQAYPDYARMRELSKQLLSVLR